MQPGSPRHAEKHGLGLVGHRVRRGNNGFLPRGQLVEPAVPQAARPILTGMGRYLDSLLHGVIQKEFHTVPAAEIRHKVGITFGGLAPDTVVDVGRQHLNFQRATVAQQKKQQRHRVCPTGAGRNDSVARLEQTLPAAAVQQSLFNTLYSFFRVRTHGLHPDC